MEEFGGGFDLGCEIGSSDHQDENPFFLPKELVLEILLRSPVKSLLRFKTICKYWYDIITSSNFADNHLDHISNRSRLLVSHTIPETETDWGTLYGLSIFPNETLAGDPPPHDHLDYLQMPEVLDYIIGPVKGLLLLVRSSAEMTKSNDYRLAILNPATREYRALVVPDLRYREFSYDSQMFGFGFDPLTGDIKVISVWYWNRRRYQYFRGGHPRVAVYSLANDSWKHLETLITDDHKMIMVPSSTTYMNGSCYWLLKYPYTILALDLSREVFQEIEGPEDDGFRYPKLIIHNDSLAMVVDYPMPYKLFYLQYIDILVMKEEGCWTKDLRIDINIFDVQYSPIGFWKNNNLLFNTINGELAMYNPYTHEIKGLGIGIQVDDYWYGVFSAFIYKESLVSLKGGNTNHGMYYLLQDFFSFCNPSPEDKYYTDHEENDTDVDEDGDEEEEEDQE